MNNLLLLSICTLVHLGYGVMASPSFTELDSLKPNQRASLQALKDSVYSIVPHDYMKEDIYLLKWLQAANFNPRRASNLLKESLRWRRENKVDQWGDPRFFSDVFPRDYPMYHDGFDKEGRPIGEAFFGDWNVRSAALSGKLRQLTHYSVNVFETNTRRVREQQSAGKNVTQWNLFINMDGFNLVNQACPTCLPLYLEYVNLLVKNWPNTLHRMILVNTPLSFGIILNLMRPVMSPQTRSALKVFGTNKAEWKPYLDELVHPEQIGDWFEGKKSRNKPRA